MAMKIDNGLIQKVFFYKNKCALRRCFGIDKNESIIFCWIPLLINQSTSHIRKYLTKKIVSGGIVATDKAIYFPKGSAVCMGKDNYHLLSDITTITFDLSFYLVISKHGTQAHKIPKDYFQGVNSNIDNVDEIMIFITGALNMLINK